MSDFKVGYITLSGAESTAYVTDNYDDAAVYEAMDKYTDEDIKVSWSDDNSRWEEIDE